MNSVAEMAERYRGDLDGTGLRPDMFIGWSLGRLDRPPDGRQVR